MKKGPPALLVGAVIFWLAFDVGSGAIKGIEDVEEQRFDDTPLSVIVDEAVTTHNESRDDAWTTHAAVRSVSPANDKVVFRLVLTESAEARNGPRITQAARTDMRKDIRAETCRRPEIKRVLTRGGSVKFLVSNRNGETLFDAESSPGAC